MKKDELIKEAEKMGLATDDLNTGKKKTNEQIIEDITRYVTVQKETAVKTESEDDPMEDYVMTGEQVVSAGPAVPFLTQSIPSSGEISPRTTSLYLQFMQNPQLRALLPPQAVNLFTPAGTPRT